MADQVDLEIRKLALKNALEYGKANQGSVLSKSLAKFPEMKSDVKSLSILVSKIVADVNKLDKSSIEKEAANYKDEFQEQETKKAEQSAKHSMFLAGAVKGNFITRFPPEPSGYMHIGHAKAAFTSSSFANEYKGKFALYFDDTNPEKEKQEYVDELKKSLKWLGISHQLEYYASDDIENLYKYAQLLISANKAYVCFCDSDALKESRMKSKGCKHKKQTEKQNLELWNEMLSNPHEATDVILRLNYDLKDPNTAMRDPTLFRVKKHAHYRQGTKYHVWPTYSFNTPIIDSTHGITDVMRDKNFELMDELYNYLLDQLKLRKPNIHSFARIEIKNNMTSKRKIRELVDKGLVWGWDDPRLVTISGLRRRGVLPQAIEKFVLRFGMSKTESEVDIEMLLTENRKLLDPNTKRLFFVSNPVKVIVNSMPESSKEIKMKMHPTSEMGQRRYRLSNVFFINASDANKLSKGAQVRLKDAFDISVESIEGNTIHARYEGDKANAPRIHWVNEGNHMSCKLYQIGNLLNGEEFNKDSLSIIEGYVESQADSLELNEVVQFERTGFYKLDSKEEFSFLSL